MYQTLHCHTKLSDGELSHKQVLKLCLEKNINVVAFTDHDALPDKRIIKDLRNFSGKKVNWIIGCELTSGFPEEIGGIGGLFHITGLFVNPFDKALKESCRKTQQSRIERMKLMVKNLKTLGFAVSAENCLKESKGESVSRPHIIAALRKKEKNLKIIRGLARKMALVAKTDPKVKERYLQMLKSGERKYPFWLFLDKKAFFPGIYADYPYYRDMDEAVKLIRGAGGVAVLAHWVFTEDPVNLKIIGKLFKEKRLDGAEIIFGIPASRGRLDQMRESMEKIERLTKKYNVIQAGGPDLHRKKEFDYFIKTKWFAEKTIGLVERIMKERKLNLEWSSFTP